MTLCPVYKTKRTPAPLRSDAEVPLRAGLCDMNDIVDDKNQYRRSLYAEYAVCVGHQLPGGGGGGYAAQKNIML